MILNGLIEKVSRYIKESLKYLDDNAKNKGVVVEHVGDGVYHYIKEAKKMKTSKTNETCK